MVPDRGEMKRYASTLFPIILAALLGFETGARAQDLSAARQFFGVPGGWTFERNPPAASTFITSDDATGFVLFFCDRSGPGFFISLSAGEERNRRSDGLLQIYPALDQPESFLLAQFSVSFPGESAFHSTNLRPSATMEPKLLLDIIRDYPTGIRLNIIRLRHDRFTPPRQVDLFLPQTSDNDGLPMEVALPLLEESCRTR